MLMAFVTWLLGVDTAGQGDRLPRPHCERLRHSCDLRPGQPRPGQRRRQGGLLYRVHGQLTYILFRMEKDNVELGRVQAEQRHVRREADRYA